MRDKVFVFLTVLEKLKDMLKSRIHSLSIMHGEALHDYILMKMPKIETFKS